MPETIFSTKDIVRSIAQKLDIPAETAEAVLKEFQNVVISQMNDSGEVRLVGFGTFKTVDRSAREARNPQTGEKLEIPAHKAVRFVPGKNLKSLGGE